MKSVAISTVKEHFLLKNDKYNNIKFPNYSRCCLNNAETSHILKKNKIISFFNTENILVNKQVFCNVKKLLWQQIVLQHEKLIQFTENC